MNLSLYDADMNRIAIIGGQFVSCLWSEGYNSTERFCLELIQTEDYKKKVRPDCYVGRDDRKTVMVIKSVEFHDGKIVATGKQATRVLDDVAMIGTITEESYIAVAVRDQYIGSSTNQYRGLEFSTTYPAVKSSHQISNKSFLAVCNSLCSDTDLGFKVERADGGLMASFYKPELNENLVFSETFGNLADPEVTFSMEQYKNYAIVLGQGEGEDRISVTVDMTNGADRRELIIDARNIQMDDGETEASYRRRLAERGIEELLKRQEALSCAFTPYAEDFGKRYDLGDILTVRLSDFGLTLQARVSKFSQKCQNNKTKSTIEVGKIIITR